MNALKRIFLGLITLTLVSCSIGYKNEGDAVYYERWNEAFGQSKGKIDADPKTFEVLKFDSYAKDDKSVFYQGEKIIGADAKTFEALGDFYARDKNFGWYASDTIKTSNGQTFRVINDYYSTDGHDVFFITEPLNVIDPKDFKFVHGEGDSECWTTDGEYYYYKNHKVPSDDYNNLKIYPESGGISNDRRWAYFKDRKLNYNMNGQKVVDTIDIPSFRVTGFLECRDKYSCINPFHGREKCSK